MGLDMYLFKRADPDGEIEYDNLVEVVYWCKVNAVHNWFVEQVQGGEDDYRTAPVSREQLQTLRDLCQQVLNEPEQAPGLLPTQGGFFLDDLSRTVKQLDQVLLDPEQPQLFYHANW